MLERRLTAEERKGGADLAHLNDDELIKKLQLLEFGVC
jgi:hypothetical protein